MLVPYLYTARGSAKGLCLMSSQFWQIVKDASLLLHKVIKSSQTAPTRSVELVIQHDIQASINNEATCSTFG